MRLHLPPTRGTGQPCAGPPLGLPAQPPAHRQPPPVPLSRLRHGIATVGDPAATEGQVPACGSASAGAGACIRVGVCTLCRLGALEHASLPGPRGVPYTAEPRHKNTAPVSNGRQQCCVAPNLPTMRFLPGLSADSDCSRWHQFNATESHEEGKQSLNPAITHQAMACKPCRFHIERVQRRSVASFAVIEIAGRQQRRKRHQSTKFPMPRQHVRRDGIPAIQ